MNLQISHLRHLYLSGALTPADLVKQLDAEIGNEDSRNIWIRRLTLDEMMVYAKDLAGKSITDLPLYGVPFAIKDNIDLAGIPTTAACPEYAYTPTTNATVVQKLIDAGAIPIGKTNLDQFATGLVGTRSPYGACQNSFNTKYISGGSSAGSAVSVALGLASFSLGTDTAGSGRVPASFNNLVGHKPSCGLLSTRGVVPACRTLDCVSIFALTAEDAAQVLESAQGFDEEDAYSRKASAEVQTISDKNFTFGVPKPEQLAFFDNAETPALFKQAIQQLESLGGKAVEIDFEPFLETARLLYEGPWLAERYAAIRDFFEAKPEAIFPVTKQVIGGATKFSAADTYVSQYKLKALQRKAEAVWNNVDIIVTPTTGTIYTIDEVNADPIRCNSNLGYYTNFMNLLDLSATAVPTGFQCDGLPFGVTICAPAFKDNQLLALAGKVQNLTAKTLGATGLPYIK
ncbi:MAG TPA: allophanate hydrolase [Methylotenera sp.]|nr:allophanate hydrolase [Methylotenera sp.]HPN01990.1 allophanate hydrolase [Methylotenera sp.]